jgi:putative peptidoglycan lipid II flippase
LQFRNRFFGIIISATGVSLIVQALAFLRQVLIAAYFGVSRDLDVYVMVYWLATFAVFTFSGIFESITVPHLVRMRKAEGEDAARLLAIAILRISFALGAIASLLLLIATPLLVPIIATGFSPAEKTKIVRLVWYFLPWTLIALPYYAAAASLKSRWRFNSVFLAEIVVVAVSIGVIAIWHDDIRALPVAYASGYAIAFVLLASGGGLWRHASKQPLPSVRPVIRNIAELYLANKIGNVAGIIDRHIQSFVPTGGVAAINYSSQLIMSLSSLLTFREIFLVPLSEVADRTKRLERLLCGVVLLATPLAGFIVCFSFEIVAVLFQRGRFDAAATLLTSEVLRIAAFGLVTGGLLIPLLRMFQIVDRIAFTNVMYVWDALSILTFGYLFVFAFRWGVQGVALAQLASSTTTCLLTGYLVSRCGIAVRWRRVFGNLGFAAAAMLVAYLIAALAASRLDGAWARLLVGGPSYGVVMIIIYGFARSHLSNIIFGLEPTPGPSL